MTDPSLLVRSHSAGVPCRYDSKGDDMFAALLEGHGIPVTAIRGAREGAATLRAPETLL